MRRTVIVNQVKVTSITDSSTLIVGDSAKITAKTRALAVQRQVAVFFKEDGEFEDYPAFTKDIPQPDVPLERVNMNVIQESPFIRVNRVYVLGVAEASALQIGTTCMIQNEARIKHFRQFVRSGDTDKSKNTEVLSQGEV